MPAPMVSVLAPDPVMAPLTVSEEPLAPVPSALHVWGVPNKTGAEIVIFPALLATLSPSAEELGATVRIPGSSAGVSPAAMVTAVTPVGLLPKRTLFTVKLLSSVEEIVGPVALVVLKFTVLATPGLACALVLPAASEYQLVFTPLIVLQLLLVLPRQ